LGKFSADSQDWLEDDDDEDKGNIAPVDFSIYDNTCLTEPWSFRLSKRDSEAMMVLGDLLADQGKIRRPVTRSRVARYLIIKQFKDLLGIKQAG
jgi:hypothetical protein